MFGDIGGYLEDFYVVGPGPSFFYKNDDGNYVYTTEGITLENKWNGNGYDSVGGNYHDTSVVFMYTQESLNVLEKAIQNTLDFLNSGLVEGEEKIALKYMYDRLESMRMHKEHSIEDPIIGNKKKPINRWYKEPFVKY